jgi:hypothetical protein
MQAPVGTTADDQALGQLAGNVLQVLDYERVAVAAPPVALNPVREHDQVATVLLAVHGHAPEFVTGDPGHDSILGRSRVG